MRRQERAVTDRVDILGMLQRAYIVRIAYQDEAGLTIVPVTYTVREEEGTWYLVFHSALEGRKVRTFLKQPTVAFEIDFTPTFSGDPVPCQNGWYFESVVGEGVILRLEDSERKCAWLKPLLERLNPAAQPLQPEMMACCEVFALRIDSCVGKRRPKP